MPSQPAISVGQAYIAAERRFHRTAMAAQSDHDPQQADHGFCAVIADSPSRNAIARQASNLAVRGFLADYLSTPAEWNIKHACNRVLSALNTWCFSQSRHVTRGSYVSSFSALVIQDDLAHLFHAGDTLVYRVRGAEFEQLTREHVADLGGYRYPSRALGMDANLDLDYMSVPLAQGDIFVFTTQAMRGTLAPSDYIALIAEQAGDLDVACSQLAQRAEELAAARGLRSDSFCFQLLRVDRLGDSTPLGFGSNNLPIPPELAPGDELDGYWVEEVLSRSERTRDYRVRDAISGDRLVLKAPAPSFAKGSAYLHHFVEQRDLLKGLRSPYLNRIEPFRREPRYHYYLVRYVEGWLLSDWLREHAESGLAQRLELSRQLIKAVNALHRRDILHQNIHPDSFMVDKHGHATLINFAACCRRDSSFETARTLARDTGLSAFSAPEYFHGGDVGRRSDQFSLAAVIYWMLSYSDQRERSGRRQRIQGERASIQGGMLPFKTPFNQLHDERDVERLSYIPLTRQVVDMPAAIDGVLKRALSPKRSLRFRRLYELMIGLRRADSNKALPNRRISRQLWLWRLVALGLLVALLALWWWNPGG